MVIFFKTSVQNIIAVQADHSFSADETKNYRGFSKMPSFSLLQR